MIKKTLPLTLVTIVAAFAFAPSAYAVQYIYFQQGWLTDVPIVHAGIAASTTSDGIKVNALPPVLGNNVLIGQIDTGVTTDWVGGRGINGASGRVTGSYSCLNSGYRCLPTIPDSDDNSHGTFTAFQEIGGFQYGQYVVPGVAPNANLISVRVLDGNGAGSSSGTSSGIVFAANTGAQVLNLSLGPIGTASNQAAFYSSIASAVNTAAAKNTYVVFAGGNSGQTFAGGTNTITGFSDTALRRMVFVGSTDSYEQLSYFSNTPGSGAFISTSGKRYDFASMWLVAPGENLHGASNATGQQGSVNCGFYSCLTQMSGTSMAAPQVTGSIALLLSQWPILRTNGGATQILEYASQYLAGGAVKTVNGGGGDVTYNTEYGQGLLDVGNAFNPIGALTVTNTSGRSVPVSSITSASMLTNQSMSAAQMKALLSNYTSFDIFQRNYKVDLSKLVTSKPSVSSASSQMLGAIIDSRTAHFADGSSLAFGNVISDSPIIGQSNNSPNNNGWFMSFTDASGSTMAAGYGFPASVSFAGALWGTDNPISNQVSSLGVSNAMLNLAEGGNFAAFGTQLDGSTRMGFSLSQTAQDESMTAGALAPNATAFGSGITTQITKSWTAGVTFGMLNEQNGLIGTTYTRDSLVSLGDNHQSMSMGVSSAFALGHKRDLLLDAAIVRTDGAHMTDGIVSDVTPLYARAMGAALVERDAIKNGDNLSFSVRAPLRVISGSASVAMTSVDGNGNPTTTNQRIGLTPNGNEVDFSVGYVQPVSKNVSWNITVDARRDDGNVAGATSADFLIGEKLTF